MTKNVVPNNLIVPIQIDRLTLDGDGIGRLSSPASMEGQAAFVPYALPEEQVEAQLEFHKKHYSRWLPLEIKKPSAQRQVPPCGYHFKPGQTSPWCGGCNWQHLAPAYQQKSKKVLLEETLTRLGGLAAPRVGEILSSPQPWRYRNKAQVPFGPGPKGLVAGFYAPGSHTIVDIEDCLIQPALAVDIIKFVKAYALANRWQPYDQDQERGWLRHLLLRLNQKGECLVTLVTADRAFPNQNRFVSELRQRFPQVVGLHQNIQAKATNVILGERWIKIGGQDRLEEQVNGFSISYSPASFFQVNTPAAELLYNRVIEDLAPASHHVVIDLYCGVGALTLSLAKKARGVVGVESVGTAIQDARFNMEKNAVDNVYFMAREVESLIREEHLGPVDTRDAAKWLLVVDPPRAGLSPQAITLLKRWRPQRLVYISCHPGTLARDIKLLQDQYEAVSFTPVDLFPQTSHIECVARLDRK
jgi:23S rRNA (uracil1939-C5)-methyltransferase